MKKSELKETLKPLIKECIKEVMFEDGTLSTIIAEVVKGVGAQAPLVEEATPTQQPIVDTAREQQVAAMKEEYKREMETQRNKLNEAVSTRFGGIDLFEGTTPISKAGQPGSPSAPSSPFQGVDPEDPGVDISKLGILGK